MFEGSLVALVTPMRPDGALDFAALDRLIEFHVESGSDGLVIGGTTGESATLERAELIELVDRCARAAAGRLAVIAGSGTNSTAKTVDLTAAVAAAGADAALVVTPYYNKPTQAGLIAHYERIADAAPIPLILYNVPARTAVDLLPPAVQRLAGHERIVGLKDATGDMERLEALLEACPDEFRILSGDDATALDWYRRGARGAISVTANVTPAATHAVWAAAAAGEFDRAAALDRPLEALHRALFVQSNPIPVKWVLSEMGMIENGIRLPLTWLEDQHLPTLRRAMAAAGLDEGGER